jgi:antirestriction protein ArdC
MSDYIYHHVTTKILEQLERGNIVWKKPWADNGPPRNLISKRPYSGVNSLLLAMEGYAAPFWATRESVVKLGGKVRPEESPSLIFFWRFGSIESPAEPDGEQTKATRWSNIFCKAYHLFNVEQCEGLEKKIPPYARTDFNPIEQCETVIKNMPARPLILEMEPQAFYMPALDLVSMPSRALFDDSAKYYSALFHEITHSTGHEKRLGRHKKMRDQFTSHHHEYSHEELVAEIGAGFLCAHAGIDNRTIENSGAYIRSWMQCFEKNQRMFFFAAAQAQSAVNFILGCE